MSRSILLSALILLAVSLVGGLPGCGGDDEATPETTGGDTPAAEDAGGTDGAGDDGDPAAEGPVAPTAVVVDAAPYIEEAEAALREAESAGTWDEAMRLKQKARLAYSAALEAGVSEDAVNAIMPKLGVLTNSILDADKPVAGVSFAYKVKSGENLWTLCNPNGAFAKKGAHVEAGFVCWLNGLKDAKRLRAGQTLHVPVGEFTLVVLKSRYRLRVFYGGGFIKEYVVGLGKDDRTPEGEFVVMTKLEKPTWTDPNNNVYPNGHAKNPLGSRWFGFQNTRKAQGYGIHGTDEPDTIGKNSSNGCIRMLNAEVVELFDWVPRQTKVVIRR
jgi:lipoprotein-anchoring transpeptidase ErfK/SrfK